MSEPHKAETSAGDRFAFGENWSRFLRVLNEQRISKATQDLAAMLGVDSLAGQTFLDIGSGSGLSSLAARRLGAKVVSFDYDPNSVACTAELRRRFFPDDPDWQVFEGSVLNPETMAGLGTFNVVYSWGVLHHTGAQWQALAEAGKAVDAGGRLFISIYNDQGRFSRWWLRVKVLYNRLPRIFRIPYAVLVMTPRELASLTLAVLALRPMSYVRSWTHYGKNRGMSRWHDLIDWVGGYPFEVAKPEEVFEFYRARGFVLEKLKTCGGGLGCNEYVFKRTTD
ncbi:MAG: class I SAM-dependent methyltransferase [Candidatus Sericytochromatia bacterium]|nr:class I SAM-dependent methyltransferase [Candidatus Sericytochromatia bacterium]